MIFNRNGQIETNMEVSLEATSTIMAAVMEDNLTHEELTTFLESFDETQAVKGEEILLEKTIVRLDKNAKISRAQKSAEWVLAKQHNDPMFKKLINIWRMERLAEAQIHKKYGSQALRLAKASVQKASNSKSATAAKAAEGAKKQFNSIGKTA